MKQTVVLIAAMLLAMNASAQDQPEYRLELGAGAGLVAYQGDFSNSLVKGMRPIGEVVVKYKPNPRMAWGLNVGYGKLTGSSKNADTHYPEVTESSFKTSLVDVGLRFEYNFWPYGTGREYYGAKRLTPFIAIGLGVSYASPDYEQGGEHTKKPAAAGQMPVGLGIKYKMADRWNIALEWMMHFTGGDRLDGISDPYGIRSSGLFKNTDCYSITALTVTYDLWAKCKTCHNDRD